MSSTFEQMLSASRARENELRLIHILIDRVEPDPDQPRKAMDPARLQELTQSVQQDGILHPLLVLPANSQGLYRIIAGERRWRAAKQAGLPRVPAFVLQRDELGRRRIQLVENLQRVDLTATERAQHISLMRELIALQAGAEGRALSERELDQRTGTSLGISDRAVRDFLAVVALPPEAQEVARDHHLSIKHLRAAGFVDREQSAPFIAATAAAGATGEEALAAARLVRDSAMPIEEALGVARTVPASIEEPPAPPAEETPAAPLRPQPGAPTTAMPRKRRAVYIRLLEIERMLSRLPLLEAAEPAEAALWARALDGVLLRATALRASLARLEPLTAERTADEL